MKKKEFTQEQIDRMVYLYTEEHKGTPIISEEFNCSKHIINRVLKERGVKLGPSGRKWTGGLKESCKRYEIKHKEERDEYKKKWSKENRKHLNEYHKQWREGNEDYQKYRRDYEKNKKDTDPSYRLACYTRTAIYTCLKERNIDKYTNTFEYLPYTLGQLIEHLEKQFQGGMTWDNYGEWHVDHERPMASFNMVSPECDEFQECWSLSNLQPLWAEENLSKGSTYL